MFHQVEFIDKNNLECQTLWRDTIIVSASAYLTKSGFSLAKSGLFGNGVGCTGVLVSQRCHLLTVCWSARSGNTAFYGGQYNTKSKFRAAKEEAISCHRD